MSDFVVIKTLVILEYPDWPKMHVFERTIKLSFISINYMAALFDRMGCLYKGT
ncbi:MAG: hypothetical protein H0U75_08385 [Legionella sp.]|nr:hypothetical protein [Legionella sp.]